MQTIEAIADIRSALDEAKGKGLAMVDISSLEEYLDGLAQAARSSAGTTDTSKKSREDAMKDWDRDIDVWKAQLGYHAAQDAEMFKAVMEAGQTALKSASLINGGAAVALLAFVGNLLVRDASLEVQMMIPDIARALQIFVFGVGFAGVATGFRYLSQFLHAGKWEKSGHGMNVIAVIFAIASFGTFFWGGLEAVQALTRGQII